MAEIGGLSVSVTAATQQFRAGISSAEDAAQDLSLSLLRLNQSADGAEDELDAVGRSAATSAGGMSAFALSTDGASLSTTRLSGVLIASLLPAIVTVTAALTPLVAALGGFVAIAGSIAGIGIIGAIAAISTNTEQLKEQFTGLVDTLRTEFAPVIEDATIVLSSFISDFEDIVPALVPAEDTINEIASLFQQLGEAVINSLPAFVDLAVTLARDFLPPLVRAARDILPRIPGFINTLVDEFRFLVPFLKEFGRDLAALLPQLLDFGRVALPIITNALGAAGDALTTVLGFVNGLDGNIQQLIARASLLLPVFTGIAALFGGPVALAIAGLVGGVIGLKKAFDTNFLGIRDIVTGFVNKVKQVLPEARNAFQAFTSGADIGGIKDSLSSLASTVSDELKKSLKALQPVFSDLTAFFEENKSEFKTLGEGFGFLVQKAIDLAAVLAKVLGFVFRNVTIPQIRLAIDVVDVLVTKLAQAINFLGQLGADVDQLQSDPMATVQNQQSGPNLVSQQQLNQAPREDRTQESEPTELEIRFDGDGELDTLLAERAEVAVKRQGERSRRLGDRAP